MTDIAIKFENVSKAYVIERTPVEALRNVSLVIPRGVIAAVTGKSGAGKSTFLHLAGLLDSPSHGRMVVGGVDTSKMNDQSISAFRNATVGFVFQMNNLLPEFSALENVMMPGLIAGGSRKMVRERALILLNAVGLVDRAKHRPGELSGGEQQRVAIARALLMQPPILLADEPTGNLDKRTSRAVQDLLIELAEKARMTMLLVTHDPDLASRLPCQIAMEDGSVVHSNLTVAGLDDRAGEMARGGVS